MRPARRPPAPVAALLLATAVIARTAAAPSSPRAVEVQGHRGARARLPENTLPAFAHALAVGADVLELDVVVTADDRLLVMHDPVVNVELCRPRDGAPVPAGTPVRTMTLAQAQRLDCGAVRHPRFATQQPVPGTPPPSLEQVIALVQGSTLPAAARVRLNVEAKSVPDRPELGPPPARYAALVVETLRRTRMLERSVLQSFDHRVLVAAHALEPALVTAVLVDESLPDLVAVARAAGARIVSPHHEWITVDEVAACRAAGLRVIPWTVNDEAGWQRMLALDVDGIITDDPEALIGFLRGAGRRP